MDLTYVSTGCITMNLARFERMSILARFVYNFAAFGGVHISPEISGQCAEPKPQNQPRHPAVSELRVPHLLWGQNPRFSLKRETRQAHICGSTITLIHSRASATSLNPKAASLRLRRWVIIFCTGTRWLRIISNAARLS